MDETVFKQGFRNNRLLPWRIREGEYRLRLRDVKQSHGYTVHNIDDFALGYLIEVIELERLQKEISRLNWLKTSYAKVTFVPVGVECDEPFTKFISSSGGVHNENSMTNVPIVGDAFSYEGYLLATPKSPKLSIRSASGEIWQPPLAPNLPPLL